MASAGSLTIDLRAETARLRTDFNKATAMAKGFKRDAMKSFKGVKDSVLSLKGALFAAAGVGGMGAVSKSFITAASTSEQYRVRLKTLLGSVEEGNRLFNEMADFAGRVPFEYEQIMGSATQLAGVMKGGVNEIKQWMPLIGDLAATSGMSIEDTTSQVIRMYSAGAASADMFREKGILAMLGFEAGVSVSAEETRERLMQAWQKQGSQFRGATDDLAKTWAGGMSMLSDKWFKFRNDVMDSGLFDWLKSVSNVINKDVNTALGDTSSTAKTMGTTAVKVLEAIAVGFGYVLDFVDALKIGWQTLKVGVLAFATASINAFDKLIEPLRIVNHLLGNDINTGLFGGVTAQVEGFMRATTEASNELTVMAMGFGGNAETIKEKLREVREDMQKTATTASTLAGGFGGGATVNSGVSDSALGSEFELAIALEEQLDAAHEERLQARLAREQEYAAQWNDLWVGTANSFARGIGDAVADALVEQKSLSDALRSLSKQVIKEVISGLIQIAIKRTLLNTAAVAEQKAIILSGVADAATLSVAYAPAAAAASLASFGANAVPAQAGIAATHALSQSLSVAGQAHSGLDYIPREGSYILDKGEMVLDKGTSEQVRNGVTGGNSEVNVTINATQDLEELIVSKRQVLYNTIVDVMNENGQRFA